jgi:hypothetical protein
MEDKLQLLYNSYIENGLLSSQTTFEQFSQASPDVIQSLYQTGVTVKLLALKQILKHLALLF